MDWADRKVLVTGAGGFIGSHLTERLVALGARVRAFVRYNSRTDTGLLGLLPPESLSQVAVVAGDLRDVDAVRGAIREVDTVFHLGALIAIPYSYLHPRDVVETNVMGTVNVLMAAREFGLRRVVHTSTSEVYGTAQYVPIDENHPLQGQSPYSASKIGADKIAESFFRSFDLPVVTVRPFNTYGPRQSARAIIPTIIAQAAAGDSVRLGDLTPARDFTFVTDTVAGFVAAAGADAAIGQVVNIGTGSSITIGELAQKVFSLLGTAPRIVSERQRLRPERSEVYRLLACNKKARDLLDWKPQVSLEEGLQRTIEWISSHTGLYRPDQYAV